MMFTHLIETPVGWLESVWSRDGGLQACGFVEAAAANRCDYQPAKTPLVRQFDEAPQRLHLLEDRMRDYFATGQLEWELDWLDWSNVPSFHRKVLEQCAQIPAGQTLTYSELASRAGSRGAARAVGSAMARNRWPLIIPCHRVVGADGRLTGYSGTGGIETKRRLLGLEAGELVLI
ncbi:MAG: methylated-DNA--[protein]-cysteine S-methyltransferase [Planctomycetales bacterium]|nr:methylated-DNA--[protein]-cysteine S-methyltransferase [Planctomycetales bacterium]